MKDGLDVERGADRAPDLAERLQLVDRPRQLARPRLQLLEEPDVLDGDHGLVGEGLEELDLLVRERLHLRPADHDGPDRRPFAQEGRGQHGANAGRHGMRTPDIGELGVEHGLNVVDVDRLAVDDRPPGGRPTADRNQVWQYRSKRPELGDPPQPIAVDTPDDRVVRAADARGVLGHRVHHGLQVGRRARDDPQDLPHRRLLLEGLRQLARPRLHLALEPRVRFLELGGHAVELVAQRLQLVARPDVDALVQLSRADPGRADPERLDGRDHPSGEEQARRDRQEHAENEETDRALDRGVESLERLPERLLDEDRPLERRDRGVHGHHAPALEVARDRDLLPRLARHRRAGQGGLDLVEPGEGRLLEHEADVRVRDEDALAVEHEGVAGLADLDLRDDVPDEFQVHLGHGDAGALAAPGHRDRHVGLRFLPEVHRPVVDLPGFGLEKLRLEREIGLAAGDVHREARDAELLAPLAVEMADLGDHQGLAQKAQVVDAALVHGGRRGAELRLGRPADLPLDLLDEPLDS